MNRTRDYYRKMRAKHIRRKQRKLGTTIDFRWYPNEKRMPCMDSGTKIQEWTNWYKYAGMLSKGKIHCSCPHCSAKVNMRHRRSHYGRSTDNWKHSDVKKLERMNYQDYDEEVDENDLSI